MSFVNTEIGTLCCNVQFMYGGGHFNLWDMNCIYIYVYVDIDIYIYRQETILKHARVVLNYTVHGNKY
jgi:hypothetical protein